jgi:hypothetical protein
VTAGPPGTARSHRRSNSEFTGPGSPYLDRDAERAYLTQIIKDDDLVSAFLAHRFFVDRLRRHCNEPVIVLIPVALPDKLRYRFLHNHVDLVLTRELRYRPDVVVARVPVRVHVHGRAAPLRTPVTRSRAQAKASRGRYQPGGCARP